MRQTKRFFALTAALLIALVLLTLTSRDEKELQKAAGEGYGAHAVFVVQMADVTRFSPNDDTHPAFGAALREAAAQGVQVHAYWCRVTPDTLEIAGEVPVVL